MKIPGSIRHLYAEQRERNERLKQQVDQTLRALAAKTNWHYESRVKSELSVTLKLESGRVVDPGAVEDFFACTLVVRNLLEIDDAEMQLRRIFTVTERRPHNRDRTHKRADAFIFDDLRLYVHWKDDPTLPPTGLHSIRFEIQIKTFLQHAWSIATHDLVYKTDDVSWSRQRIAYQIKAMLEHAEVSIHEADRLAGTTMLAKAHSDTEELKRIIALVKEVWEPEFLPSDLRRLAENTRTVMRLANMQIARLREVINAEKERLKGRLPVNLSPYAIIVQSVAWHEPDAMRIGLEDAQRREKICVTDEVELPDWIRSSTMVNVVRVLSP